jgi:hypothetical protein
MVTCRPVTRYAPTTTKHPGGAVGKKIETREDYEAALDKYGKRLKLVLAKHEDVKKELVVLQKAFERSAPAAASAEARKSYEVLQDAGANCVDDIQKLIKSYDRLFADAQRSLMRVN